MDESDSSLCVKSAKSAFLDLVARVDPAQAMDFVEWVSEQCNCMLSETTMNSDEDEEEQEYKDGIMDRIVEDLRKRVPFEGVLSSEKIMFPESEQVKACLKPSTTIHIDAFLYNDEEIEKLCDEGKINRHHCNSCGSHDIKPLDFISHSMSQDQLTYIFKDILPNLLPSIEGAQLVDVGSRLGAVLYGAALYSPMKNIFGVEMNKEFCQIQQEILQKYKLDKRVKIICSDICQQELLLRNANVVILNNVFEFFQPQVVQARTWQFLRSSITKKGCIIVSVPSLEEATKLSSFNNQYIIDLDNWVDRLLLDGVSLKQTTNIQHNEVETKEIYFYQVK
ncbi:uncharacterized protein LOC116302733 [Actinia tenebrosa]|uniref:Uncharacterized protein LOC116302733 n=1 Tax=Actinia tenebrosa TaxID=6105 RepID=A0A6P8ILU4_ACTTE|nr:uncharacterized protein LOC116302733 [Actinia tenebrosa]